MLLTSAIRFNSKATVGRLKFGFEEKSTTDFARVYRTFLEAEQFATSRALNKILTRNEMRVAAMFNSSDYTKRKHGGDEGNGKWDTAGGTMLEDINSGCELVYFATGLKPNVLIISEIAVNRIRIKNSQLLDAIKSAGAGQAAKPSDITAALLAQATGMDRVIIAGASEEYGRTSGSRVDCSNLGQSRNSCSRRHDQRHSRAVRRPNVPLVGRRFTMARRRRVV